MKIKFLKAFNGDSILFSFKDGEKDRNILIDGGMPATYYSSKDKKGKQEDGELKNLIKYLRDQNQIIDLLILTHVDNDHIGGVLRWFENDKTALDLIDKVWFNSGRLIKESYEVNKVEEYDNSIEFNDDIEINTSIGHGVKFEDFIEGKKDLWERKLIKTHEKLFFNEINFTILSPDAAKLKLLLNKWEKEKPESLETAMAKNDYDKSLKEHIHLDVSFEEDKSVHNGSSISFILCYEKKKFLFLGDAHSSVLVKSLLDLGYSKINPLKLDMVKLSHHGSMHNNSKELFELLDCNKYVISTNGDKHSHPHKRLLARLINQNNSCELYFNYSELIGLIFSDIDKKDFPNVKTLDSAELSFNL